MAAPLVFMNDRMRRTAVLVEVVKCIASATAQISVSAVLAHVMKALDAPEEAVGGDVYLAVLVLTRSHPFQTTTPGTISSVTDLAMSVTAGYWLAIGPAEPDEREVEE